MRIRGEKSGDDAVRRADDAAVSAWYEVPDETRARVFELAVAGEPHPDADVRAAAENWARAILRRRPWGLIGLAFSVVGSLALSGLWWDDTGGTLDRNNIHWRRQARRVLRAAEATSPDGPSAADSRGDVPSAETEGRARPGQSLPAGSGEAGGEAAPA